MGIKVSATNPSKLLAQGIPNLCNMGVTKSGKAAANIDRKKVLAATALAEYVANVSMR